MGYIKERFYAPCEELRIPIRIAEDLVLQLIRQSPKAGAYRGGLEVFPQDVQGLDGLVKRLRSDALEVVPAVAKTAGQAIRLLHAIEHRVRTALPDNYCWQSLLPEVAARMAQYEAEYPRDSGKQLSKINVPGQSQGLTEAQKDLQKV